MSQYHAWKRRLWGPGYPIENGPPFLTSDGSPLLPGGVAGGPYQGVDDDGPSAANPVVLTFTGPATGALVVSVLILDQTAGAPPGGRWVGALVEVADAATADEIGAAIAADFESRNWPGWTSAVNSLGTVTFTPVDDAGTTQGWVAYAPPSTAARSTAVNPPTTPLEPGGVDGPNPSENGLPFWISRSGGQGKVWYYWIDTDNEPGPDTKRLLGEFLDDTGIGQAYRDEVRARATALGYGA